MPPKPRRRPWRACASWPAHPKVLAIGEIGLDYHYDFSPRDVQRAAFEQQLAIAAEARKPIVIHTRESRLVQVWLSVKYLSMTNA